jgi:hypothetical protein
MVVFTGLWTWFLVEYLYHEHVHLYTYDLFAERLGFKLAWGCLFFYPLLVGAVASFIDSLGLSLTRRLSFVAYAAAMAWPCCL